MILMDIANVHEFFLSENTHRRMKKISWESEAVPTVSTNFGYFINTKFVLFYRRNVIYNILAFFYRLK